MKPIQLLVLLGLITKTISVKTTEKLPIYIDNGHDQTEIDHFMTSQEKQEVELEVLSLLGLPSRPRKINSIPLNKSASRFLLDVYKKIIEEESEDDNAEKSSRRIKRSEKNGTVDDISLSGEEEQQISESDLIMTFEVTNHHGAVRHERGKRLWFNVSDVPLAEDLVGAELRMYQTERHAEKNPEEKFTVTVYQLINSDNGDRELEYITAVNTTAAFSGWLGLNVSSCLATWVAFPTSNKGLYLSVHPVGRPGHEIRPEDIGLITVKGDDEMQPFMVGFLKAKNHVSVRHARSTYRPKQDVQNLFKGTYKNIDSESSRTTCQIHTLYISFKDLKWQDWIIAPDGYAAYYCHGECNFPLNAHMNATNHAIVQTLVHLMNPLRFPKPCCAPTKLTPISVLYFLDDSNVVLKKYKKMAVKSCGCH